MLSKRSFKGGFSSGLSFLVAYTVSKTMSNTDSGFSTFNGLPIDKFNKKQNYSIAGDDRTHILNVSGVYELPIGPGKKFLNHGGLVAKNLLSGWQISGVLQYASGTPLQIVANGSPLRTGNFANLVAGQSINVNLNNYYKGLPFSMWPPFHRRETLPWVTPTQSRESAQSIQQQ